MSYCQSKFYIAGTGIFKLFGSCDLELDPMTFTYELDPYSLELYCMCESELPTSALSKVIVRQTNRHVETYRQTDRQTDTTEIIFHSASRVINNRMQLYCASYNKNEETVHCH